MLIGVPDGTWHHLFCALFFLFFMTLFGIYGVGMTSIFSHLMRLLSLHYSLLQTFFFIFFIVTFSFLINILEYLIDCPTFQIYFFFSWSLNVSKMIKLMHTIIRIAGIIQGRKCLIRGKVVYLKKFT